MTEKVLDIGITIEVPMEDGRIVSDIDARTVNLELAQSCLSYRCTFRNSTKMAALAQIWNRGDSDSYVFVKLGDHVTSSLVYQGSVLDFASVNGALGCMLMTDGTHRTLEEVMGAETLFKAAMAQNMTDFNEKLDKQDTVTVEIWETYIHHLAKVLHNLNYMFGWRIVLGGMLSPLVKKSCDRLQKKLNEYAVLFPGKRAEFVFSELGEYAAGVGAAQLPIDEFLGNIEIQ